MSKQVVRDVTSYPSIRSDPTYARILRELTPEPVPRPRPRGWQRWRTAVIVSVTFAVAAALGILAALQCTHSLHPAAHQLVGTALRL